MEKDDIRTGRVVGQEKGTPPEMLEFVRYVAGIASRITTGEADPEDVNWRYIRDRAASAMLSSDNGR